MYAVEIYFRDDMYKLKHQVQGSCTSQGGVSPHLMETQKTVLNGTFVTLCRDQESDV